MSFDLYFCRPNEPIPSIPELKEYFSSLPGFSINDVADGGVDFEYQNEATGVHCLFSYSPLDADELEGCGSTGLTFNLNFNRPSFFAYESMPLVEACCKHFNLLVKDPQDQTPEQQADATGLISSWRNHNTWAVRAFKKMAQEQDIEVHYLPETSATAWWQYAKVRQSLEGAISEDIFVPSPFILINSANKLFTMLVWPDGISQFFPRSDYVYVQREKKSFLRTKKEAGLVAYDSVIAKIGHMLADYEFGGLQIKYLRPERTSEAVPLIQSFNLEPLDLSQCGQVAPSRFHDVGASD